MSLIKSIKVNDSRDSIEIILNDNTILEVKADYSGYEDCADLVLFVDGQEKLCVPDIFVGYDDSAYERNKKRRLNNDK